MPLIRVVDLRQERAKAKSCSHSVGETSRPRSPTRLEKRSRPSCSSIGADSPLHCFAANAARPAIVRIAVSPSLFTGNIARLSCHLCGHTAAVPKKCPACGKDALIYAGFGTEKVEATVSQIFPAAVVRRMDADSMTRKDAYRDALRSFRAGKIDILVGTQMIAKGLHFPNVTLVGIINADLALHMPDFRAGERTFPASHPGGGPRRPRRNAGRSLCPDLHAAFSPSIQFARHHDFAGYFQQELEFRERCDFPPFKHAVLITVRSAHEGRAPNFPPKHWCAD